MTCSRCLTCNTYIYTIVAANITVAHVQSFKHFRNRFIDAVSGIANIIHIHKARPILNLLKFFSFSISLLAPRTTTLPLHNCLFAHGSFSLICNFACLLRCLTTNSLCLVAQQRLFPAKVEVVDISVALDELRGEVDSVATEE